MKEFTLETGEFMTIKPMTAAVLETASRQLAREGIVVKADSPIHDNIELQSETVRQVLVAWKLPDGSEPLAGLRPAKARQVIRETPGMESVLETAQALAKKAAEARKIDLGN